MCDAHGRICYYLIFFIFFIEIYNLFYESSINTVQRIVQAFISRAHFSSSRIINLSSEPGKYTAEKITLYHIGFPKDILVTIFRDKYYIIMISPFLQLYREGEGKLTCLTFEANMRIYLYFKTRNQRVR